MAAFGVSFVQMGARRAAVWLAIGTVALAGAAERPAAQAGSDYVPPQLVSRTGGGPRWTSIADVKRDAEKGVPAACFELAACYENGRNVPKDVVKAIARVPRDSDDKPLSPVILQKVTIVPEGQPLPPDPNAAPALKPPAAAPKP